MGEFFVYSLFFGIFLFLFPVFVDTDNYLDVGENKAWFSVSLFKYLRVFGGYGEIRKEGIAVHITKKYCILIKYADMGATRKKFEITKGFQLYRLHQIVETGGAESAYGAAIGGAIQSAADAAFAVLKTRYPFLSLKNSTVLAEEPCLKIAIETTVIFNGLILTIAFAKKLLEALWNWIRKRKSTASWKKRQNALQGSST